MSAPAPMQTPLFPLSTNPEIKGLKITSPAWIQWFQSVVTSSLASLKATVAGLQSKVSGAAGDFVNIGSSGEIQDAGTNPDITKLQHNHSSANTGGSISQQHWAGCGTFAFANTANNLTVNDANVTANSAITIFAVNATAALAMAANTVLYESLANRVAGVSFQVNTGNGANISANANFQYVRIG